VAGPHGVNGWSRAGQGSTLQACPEQRCSEEVSGPGGCKLVVVKKKMLCGGSRVKRQGGHQTRESCSQINQMPRTFWDRLRAVMSPDGGWSDVFPREICLQPRPTARAVTSPEAPWLSVPAQVVSAERLCSPMGVTANGQT
jgi:hypothetical protein